MFFLFMSKNTYCMSELNCTRNKWDTRGGKERRLDNSSHF